MSIIRPLLLLLFICQASFAAPPKDVSPSTPPAELEQKTTPPAPAPALPLEHPVENPVAPLPSSTDITDSYQGAFIRMLCSLAGLLVLVFATFWFLKRMGKGKLRLGSSRSIQILEKRPLSPKTVLYVVEIEGKQVLISESQLEVRALTTLEPKVDLEE